MGTNELFMKNWFRNIYVVVTTVLRAMWVTLRYWLVTYKSDRGTHTEQYEFPEKPLVVADRFRGFHRYDLTACIACEACVRACPVECIYTERQRVPAGEGKGFYIEAFTVDYTKCMFCGMCVEACPKDCLEMGHTHDLSCYSRNGCLVDFARIPVEIAWGEATLNPLAVAQCQGISEPVHVGPNRVAKQEEAV